MKRIEIAENNPMNFLLRVVEAAQDGFVIDEDGGFSMFFNLYTVEMTKVTEEENALFSEGKKAGRPKKVVVAEG